MEKLIITGGQPLAGTVTIGGAKNMAMKAIIAALLTDEPVTLRNIPLISSVLGTIKIIEPLGVRVRKNNHSLTIESDELTEHTVPLELGGLYRTATMVMGPLLARFGQAVVPNPGGCRLGKRPVDWHVAALEKMGAKISYRDGYFNAQAKKLHGAKISFAKNTHTGTETVLMAAVLAEGETVIENAAQEPEVDDLICMLNRMGAKIQRHERTITVSGVNKLHGIEYTIMPDRNEAITYAVAAIASKGDVCISGVEKKDIAAFLRALDEANAGWEEKDQNTIRFFYKGTLQPTNIVTGPHPQFMTDWQQPWAVLTTQANGMSTIHETVFENRFSYVSELEKMGAEIEFFSPKVDHPENFYNFAWKDRIPGYHQAIRIKGPTPLHEAVLEMTDIRAGATLVLAALVADGTSVIREISHLDRGYERLDEQLARLGANITRTDDAV